MAIEMHWEIWAREGVGAVGKIQWFSKMGREDYQISRACEKDD